VQRYYKILKWQSFLIKKLKKLAYIVYFAYLRPQKMKL
jgi:hypothetical protein